MSVPDSPIGQPDRRALEQGSAYTRFRKAALSSYVLEFECKRVERDGAPKKRSARRPTAVAMGSFRKGSGRGDMGEGKTASRALCAHGVICQSFVVDGDLRRADDVDRGDILDKDLLDFLPLREALFRI